VDTRLIPGHAARVLLDASTGADMIVLGNHRAGPLAARVLGSVSQKIVRHAHMPVLVVHEHDHWLGAK
jgi:nucleotide-binding universal stress UspA family protein